MEECEGVGVVMFGLILDLGYLYHDSEAWNDLRTLLWHNK